MINPTTNTGGGGEQFIMQIGVENAKSLYLYRREAHIQKFECYINLKLLN